MRYQETPKVSRYVTFIARNRAAVIGLFLLLAILTLSLGRFSFVLSDERFWLGGSQELAMTKALGIVPENVQHLRVYVDRFDDDTKAKLAALHTQLTEVPGVRHVDSLFSSRYIYNDKATEGSSLIKALPLSELNAAQAYAFIRALPDAYRRYVTEHFDAFDFYLYGDERLAEAQLSIPFAYTLDETDSSFSYRQTLLYLGLIVLAVIFFFRFIFHNYVSAFAALIVVSGTLLFTFELIYLITGLHELHLALGLIIIAIALVDYLYFYYRWHVTQYRDDSHRALLKSLNRTVTPALWTTVITAVGLGTLLFSENEIVRMLSISIIGASLIALLLNTTLLIALLSYFRVRHPRVRFSRPVYYFVSRELEYNPKLLRLLNLATIGILLLGLSLFLTRADLLLSPGQSGRTLVLTVPFDEIDPATVEQIDTFASELTHRFASVNRVDSVAALLHLIHQAEAPGEPMDDQAILRALFFIDMYDLNQRYFDDEKQTLKLTLFMEPGVDTAALLTYLRGYQALPLHFSDVQTLVRSAKQQQIVVLAASLFTALVIIGLIMGIIFGSGRMIYIGFITNAIPIAWFGLAMEMLDTPVNLEMLIAMSISVGLGSDATVHFAFKYFRARFFGRSRKHALEITFFYGAVPVVIGAFVLVIFFASLMMTSIASLRDIGKFGAELITLSLATDLLLLPVFLLSIDPYPKSREIHKDHCTI
ncbi:hypothetical protein WCX18_01735 [Sulfurimonas sp. HSL1-2]|uniref:hypothetical protein n=1 Tax=Thiomicrolovo zhangzhouensis TaxID=3131933 RepID=UPI0031F9BB50